MSIDSVGRLSLPRGSLDRVPSPAFVPSSEDFVELLKSPDFDTRLQTLNRLMAIVKRDPGWFSKFTKKGEMFKNLDRILAEDRWEVQHQGIKFITEAMSSFGNNLEYCVCYLMPNIVPKLGSSKITVRRASVQAINTFLKLEPKAWPAVSKIIVTFLLGPSERAAKLEVISELPQFFQQNIREENWNNFIDGVTKYLSTLDKDRDATEKCVLVLRKLEAFLGSKPFSTFLKNLPADQVSVYEKCAKEMKIELEQNLQEVNQSLANNRTLAKSGERRFRFGIVPTYVEAMLNDEEPTTRMAALEKLKVIIEKITPDEIAKLVPHLHSYFVQIGYVLADLNFKVVVMALDLVRLTVNRLKQQIEAHLQQVVQMISRHFGNQKAVVKQIIMMTCMDLFQNLNPKSVVAALIVFLDNKNSRTREEVVNILTAALMTANPGKLNFTTLANVIVPLLSDQKRRVRLAAFEQLSVVAYLMNGKIEPLLRVVREAEEKQNLPGLHNAVMSRLLRQLLPRIRYDGLIEYATPPVTESAFDVEEARMKDQQNADLYWILHANTGESGERASSPISLAAFKPEIRVSSRRPNTRKGSRSPSLWEQDSTDKGVCVINKTIPFVERMQSDDQIVRKPGSGKAVHPNESTNSWHAPSTKRPNAIPSAEQTRSISAVVNNRLNGNANAELNTSLDRVRFNALQKKHELNNNLIVGGSGHAQLNGSEKFASQQNLHPTASGTQNKQNHKARKPEENGNVLSRTRSDGHLAGEVGRQLNTDDTPIKPSKNGQYGGFGAPPTEPFGSLGKKSTSHHSLPVASATVNKAKKHQFLKSGTGNRVKPTPLAKAAAGPRHSLPVERSRTIDGASGGTIQSALRKIDSEEWESKVDGIRILCSLCKTNPGNVADQLGEVTAALVNESKNLRSSVSREAITTIGTMFESLKGKADSEIEKTTTVLMTRSGDVSNAFIREDANDSLDKIVNFASPNKVLQSLISSGLRSKNNTIRASCASFIAQLVQRVGRTNVINSQDFLSKVVPALCTLSKDQTPTVRQTAKTTLYNLSQDQKFDAQIRKTCMENDSRTVREIVTQINKKGGADSLDATSTSLGGTLSRSGSVRKGNIQRKLPDSVQLDLDECRADLASAGWEKRISGLRRFEELSEANLRAVASDTKLVEAFIGRLSDINSKVSLEGMETYLATLPNMARMYAGEGSLKSVLNQLILSLMSHLPSKSEEHRQLAQNCLIETVRQVDGAALSPAIAAASRKANVKQRPFMLNMFTKMNNTLYSSKPKQVEVHSLPVLFELLKSPQPDAENKKALQDFARSLARLLGEKSLFDSSTSGLDSSKKALLEQMLR